MESIADRLERRFVAMWDLRTNSQFFYGALGDYAQVFCSSPEVGKIVERIAMRQKRSASIKNSLAQLASSYFIGQIVEDVYSREAPTGKETRAIKSKIPTFLTKDVEGEFQLFKDFSDTWENTLKEDAERKRASLSLIDPAERYKPIDEETLYDIQKLHNEVIDVLRNNKPSPPIFNKDTGVLMFRGKTIAISKRGDSIQNDVLDILMNEPENRFDFTDLSVKMKELPFDTISSKNVWRKYYEACKAINEKVAAETTVKKFLLFSTKSTQINPEYLKG